MSPVDHLLSWFSAVDPLVRHFAATRALWSIQKRPNISLEGAAEEMLVQELLAWKRSPSVMQVIGVLCIRASVSFMFHRHDVESTPEARARWLDSMREQIRLGIGVELARQAIERRPERDKQNDEAAALWRELCRSGLSDEALMAWDNDLVATQSFGPEWDAEIEKARLLLDKLRSGES